MCSPPTPWDGSSADVTRPHRLLTPTQVKKDNVVPEQHHCLGELSLGENGEDFLSLRPDTDYDAPKEDLQLKSHSLFCHTVSPSSTPHLDSDNEY